MEMVCEARVGEPKSEVGEWVSFPLRTSAFPLPVASYAPTLRASKIRDSPLPPGPPPAGFLFGEDTDGEDIHRRRRQARDRQRARSRPRFRFPVRAAHRPPGA